MSRAAHARQPMPAVLEPFPVAACREDDGILWINPNADPRNLWEESASRIDDARDLAQAISMLSGDLPEKGMRAVGNIVHQLLAEATVFHGMVHRALVHGGGGET